MEGVWGEALSKRRIKARDLGVEREAGYLNMCTILKFHKVICHTYVYIYMQLHSSEVDDGYEWGRLNLQSVTEESRLDEFLSTAQLAGTEFTAGQFVHIPNNTQYSIN